MEKRTETNFLEERFRVDGNPKMETTIVYWGYIGTMEKKTETIVLGYMGSMV